MLRGETLSGLTPQHILLLGELRRYAVVMPILIDPPQWPAHGTLWSHLVSDTSLDELHTFARELGLPRRSFDLDHYDVPASIYERAVAHGALQVSPKTVVHRLRSSGLRVRQIDRSTATPISRRQYLSAEWAQLGRQTIDERPHASTTASAHTSDWHHLGVELIGRWNEPHRRYHDERHLEDVLLALNHLEVQGEHVSPATLLAAWFHDAIYDGNTGADERASAELAAHSLNRLELTPALVHAVTELVVATIPAQPALAQSPTTQPLTVQPPTADATAPHQTAVAHLLDADLAIFAASPTRYQEYTTAVREEYSHVPDEAFRSGRAAILGAYLTQPTLYRSPTARRLWEQRARENVAREFQLLSSSSSSTVS